MAPEVTGLVSSEAGALHSAVDMWALGTLVFRIVVGSVPFTPVSKLYHYILDSDGFPVGPLQKIGATSDCCDFIRRLLILMPEDRLTAQAASSHAWIMDIDGGVEESEEYPVDAR
jgi:calcium/calmodulin-dependent protein kinase I